VLYTGVIMKSLISHRLFRLFFLLLGIYTQDHLGAMNVTPEVQRLGGLARDLHYDAGFKPLTRKQAGAMCNDFLRALKATADFKKLGQKRRNRVQRALYRIYPKLEKQFSGKIHIELYVQEVRIVLEREGLFKHVREVFKKLIRTMIYQDEKNHAYLDEDAEKDEDRKQDTSCRSLNDRLRDVSLENREDDGEDLGEFTDLPACFGLAGGNGELLPLPAAAFLNRQVSYNDDAKSDACLIAPDGSAFEENKHPASGDLLTPEHSPKKTNDGTPQRKADDFKNASSLLNRIIPNAIRFRRAKVNNQFIKGFLPIIQCLFSEQGAQKLDKSGDTHWALAMIVFEDRTIITEFLDAVFSEKDNDDKALDLFIGQRIDGILKNIQVNDTKRLWRNKYPVSQGTYTFFTTKKSRTFNEAKNKIKEALKLVKQCYEGSLLQIAQEFLFYVFEFYSWNTFYKKELCSLDSDVQAKSNLYEYAVKLGGNFLLQDSRLTTPSKSTSYAKKMRKAIALGKPSPGTAAAYCEQISGISKLGSEDAGRINQALLAGMHADAATMKWQKTDFYMQDCSHMVRDAMELEIGLGIPQDKSVFAQPVIIRDHHIFDLTWDREDDGDSTVVARIQGGHFGKCFDNVDNPKYSVRVPACLINDFRAGHGDFVIGMKNVTDQYNKLVKETKSPQHSSDQALRQVEWTIQLDKNNPLFKAQVSGNGTLVETKTIFPDCFKNSFSSYIQELYKLINTVRKVSEPGKETHCFTTPVGKVNVRLNTMRAEGKNVETSVYSCVHEHFFGCRDDGCTFSKQAGTVMVTIYVRREILSPTHTLTTIMSMHPVL